MTDPDPNPEQTSYVVRYVFRVLTLPVVLFSVVQYLVIYPKFIDIFSALKVDLPLPTQLVLFLVQYPILYLFLTALFVVLLYKLKQKELVVAAFFAACCHAIFSNYAIFAPILAIQEALRKK